MVVTSFLRSLLRSSRESYVIQHGTGTVLRGLMDAQCSPRGLQRRITLPPPWKEVEEELHRFHHFHSNTLP